MPLLWTNQVYQAMYRAWLPDGSREVSYSREFGSAFARKDIPEWFAGRASRLIARGIAASHQVVVVGAGFGFLCEALKNAGVPNVVGVDPSPYIHARLATQKRSDIVVVNATVGGSSIAGVLQAAGVPRTYDWVIDEDAASSHSDAELPLFYAGCEALLKGNNKARVVHMVTPAPGGDSAINWKTLAQWQATAPTHAWLDIREGSV